MKYYIALDHAGLELKKYVKELFENMGHEVIDLGPLDTTRVDYPDFAIKVCDAVNNNSNSNGILICGTGIGMSMSANKCNGIRAALCHNVYSAHMAKQHNDANVLCLGQRVSGFGMVESIANAWNEKTFEGGRHKQRVEKINSLDSSVNKI